LNYLKKIVQNTIPLELKYLENKVLKLKTITNFDTLDSFLEKTIQNQSLLEEACDIRYAGVNKVSIPIKIFIFFEQLRQLAMKFREFLCEGRKLNL